MTTFLIIIPFFAVIACGFIASRRKIIDSAGRTGLNRFVYYFALPVLTFSLMAQSDLEDQFQLTFVVAYLCVAFTLFFLSFLVARLVFQLGRSLSVVFATACIYGNTGYFGLPFVIIAFGQDASVPVIVCTTIDLAVMLPLASMMLEKSETGRKESSSNVYTASILSVIKNPLIVAAVLGAMLSLSGLQVPEAADRFVVLLGSAAAPCALFALGSSIDEDRAEFLQLQIFVISLIKLVIHPLLIWFAMSHLFSVDEGWARSAVIAAAMPVAVTAYILAQQYNIYVARTSASILLSTLVSVATLTFIVTRVG
ncbi:MAG: AEC family transporter [Acidiferrobacterales bacterium]|nr:AEC family transporter [Acidiferrobacterales bacterium]